MVKLLETLEDNDDVQNVWANADISETRTGADGGVVLHIRSVLGPDARPRHRPRQPVGGLGRRGADGGGLGPRGPRGPSAGLRLPLELRLVELFARLSETLQPPRPDRGGGRGRLHLQNARSALVLGQARGVALLVAAQAGLPVFEYAPALVKRAVGAGGAGAKEAVARWSSRLPRADRHPAGRRQRCARGRGLPPAPRRLPLQRRRGPSRSGLRDARGPAPPSVIRPARSGA